jgi:hypothetical protein
VRRNHATASLLAGGFVSGASLFALAVWVVSMIVGRHYSALVYVVAGVIGGGVGMGLLPYVSLVRSDGADAEIVASRGRRGRADAPIEGAEAVDERELEGRALHGH